RFVTDAEARRHKSTCNKVAVACNDGGVAGLLCARDASEGDLEPALFERLPVKAKFEGYVAMILGREIEYGTRFDEESYLVCVGRCRDGRCCGAGLRVAFRVRLPRDFRSEDRARFGHRCHCIDRRRL